MAQITVIIPAYRPKGFTALVQSMHNNADADAEWIVVDDGSGSEYDPVFASLPPHVTVLRQVENRRQGAARNVGLAQACGAWVKFLDADDTLDQGHLRALHDAAQTGDGIPFAATKHIFSNGTYTINQSWRDLPPEPHAQFVRQLVRPFLHHCGALFPRSLLQELGGYDESLITDEDGDLLLRVLAKGHYFTPVEGVHYEYVHHSEGPRVSADDTIDKMRARIKVGDWVQAAFGTDLPDDLAVALAQRMDKIAMTNWQVFPEESQTLFARARTIAPGYQPDLRRPLLLLRRIGGPGLVNTAQALHRRLRGRPTGGTQG